MNLELLCEDVTPFLSSFWQILRENIYERDHVFKYCIISESIASLVSEDFTS